MWGQRDVNNSIGNVLNINSARIVPSDCIPLTVRCNHRRWGVTDIELYTSDVEFSSVCERVKNLCLIVNLGVTQSN